VSRSRQALTGLLVIAAGLFFGLSDPSNVPSFALITGFVLLVVVLYQVTYGLLTVVSWYGLLPAKAPRRRLAVAVTGLVGCVLALQSSGQLSNRDILVLIPLVLGIYLYTYAVRAE
jgi:hypothetical protein